MEIIIKNRNEGKTSQLISLADNYNGYIVCADRDFVQHIMKIAKTTGKNINMPITFDEFVRKQYYGAGVDKFYIDNADLLLQYLTAVRIEAITLTNK